MDKEILFSLLINNFDKWYYYLMNYLNQNKNFRTIFSKCLSKMTQMKYSNKKFYLDRHEELDINTFTETDSSFTFIFTKDQQSNNILLTFK